jgi:hypothetical protein
VKIRENAERVEVYNSGLVVFLYDEANRAFINETAPDILSGFSPDGANDERLKLVAQQGALVVYELRQDDSLLIDVCVGEPLTIEERQSLPLLAPQTTMISLPSGKLCIESYDALQLGDEDPTDPGATVNCDRGDYILNLYRTDWLQLQEPEESRDATPGEFIVLTPQTSTNSVDAPPPLLLFPVE